MKLGLFVQNYFKLLALSTVLLAGCASIEKEWSAAKEANTIESYSLFEKKYPKSDFADDAAWEIAKRENTYWSYGSFISRYPESNMYQEAKTRLFQQLDLLSDAWSKLKEGMSISEVVLLIGPIDKRFKSWTEETNTEEIQLLSSLIHTTHTYEGRLYSMKFVNNKLVEWKQNTAWFTLSMIR